MELEREFHPKNICLVSVEATYRLHSMPYLWKRRGSDICHSANIAAFEQHLSTWGNSVLIAPSEFCSLILHLFFSSHTDNYLFHHQLITSHEKPGLIQACHTKWGNIVLNRTGSPKFIFCSKIGLTSNWPLMEACWGWLGPLLPFGHGTIS